MQCMKCGREIPVGTVFCEDCLADMAKYPVKPDTVVTLPPQQKPHPVKKQIPRRPVVSLEEQVKTLRKRVRVLSWSLTLSTALLIGISALAVTMFLEDKNEVLPGQNYSGEDEAGVTDEWYTDRFTDIADAAGTVETEDNKQQVDGTNNNIEKSDLD